MKLKSIFTKKCNTKFLALFSLLLFIISIIPLLKLSVYSHACADDFTYGSLPHSIWNSSHSLFQTILSACTVVKNFYYSWQGTFSSMFLMALTPVVFGEQFYFITPYIMIIVITLSHFTLLHVVLVKLLNSDTFTWYLISSIVCFILIQSIHSPVNAFYWYNGSVHYIFMHGCFILLLAFTMQINLTNSIWKKLIFTILSTLFSLICGGANYITALLGLVCLSSLALLNLLKRKNFIWITFPVIVYIISFYINISAPGNFIRQEHFNQLGPFQAIIKSFLAIIKYMPKWITPSIILLMVLLVPTIWNLVAKSSFSFRFPLLSLAFSLCLIACMFTPNYYSISHVGPARVFNIIKMWFLLLLIFNEIYFIGWFCKHFSLSSKQMPHFISFYIIIIVLLLIQFKMTPTIQKQYSSYAAYVSLKTGEAHQYDFEYSERLDELLSPKTKLVLKPFSVKPRLLYFDDITEDPLNWKNTSTAAWYQKELIVLDSK